MTSNRKPYAVLFTKRNCGPCVQTKQCLNEVIAADERLYEVISTLEVEQHSSLRECYNLNKFPTLIITDQNEHGDDGDEIRRIVGGKAIRAELADILKEIYTERALNG